MRLRFVAVLFIAWSLPLRPAGAATFQVNSALDTGDAAPGNGVCDDGTGRCTLRAAIEEANAKPGSDLITFAIPGAGPYTIAPAGALPDLTDAVVIDGFTQPGAAPNSNPWGQGTNAVMMIEINGNPGLSGPFTDGFVLSGGGSTVRGLVINRVGRVPIYIQSNNNVVEGNFLGTDVAGTIGLANGFAIEVNGSNNRIGGSTAAARNVISFGNSSGVRVSQPGNTIEGNFIGTNAAGTAALGHQFEGIDLQSLNNVVRRNLISGNGRFFGRGIVTVGNTVIEENYIGTDVTGTLPIGNRSNGIECYGTANTIGNASIAGRGNIIAYNGEAGVAVVRDGADGNPISGNSIYSNSGLGIELTPPAGPNPNDPGDVDTGSNLGQNYPTLSSAALGPGPILTVTGSLDSKPGTQYRLEFFFNPACDPSLYGEGRNYLGSRDVVTGGGGTVNFSFVFATGPIPSGSVTGTATDPGGNTSEFSRCVATIGSTPSKHVTWGSVKARYR